MTQAQTEVQTPGAHRSEPIPGYKLRQRIGAGGYGEVWAAEAPGQLVKAIKFVYGQMDEARAARELKSLNLIKGVRHPFLLSLERIEVVDDQLVIVTELADGSLKDRCEECVKSGGPGIPRAELLAHLADAADALDYMNSQHSLQHLDVKPENLLLVGGRIKVADFGLVKDMQEVSASLMGGLTPIYAPPEVFDARPSRRSDQYSLAIVYQEMLTGSLPFPGKMAAQLAAQHMSARPQLQPLPAGDQSIIGRALSKEPAQRFASCREMIDALLRGGGAKNTLPPSAAIGTGDLRTTAAFEGPSSRLSAYAGVGQTQTSEQEVLRRVESAKQAVEHEARENYALAEQAALDSLAASAANEPQAAPPLVDLPPLEIDPSAAACRPTLFLGVGGLAGKTLPSIRRRIEDRCSDADREKFAYLLLDTDSRELTEATHGQGKAPLRTEETLPLPLRKSADYRNDSRKYLDWLSRRWLFNIPRSQQTEGIRPFGRLAFADHADEVMARLRAAVKQLAAAAQIEGTGGPAPRIVVVGSSSGGAASGMVLDLAFAARQVLDEVTKCGEVELVLLHGTSRQPAAQELAAVNTFALLTELNHYLRPGGIYPGEGSAGVQSRPASTPGIAHAYLIHLGQDLGSEQFLAACDRVAEYLYLDTATPAGAYLAACRSANPQQPRRDVTLRSFGLCEIGFPEDIIGNSVESLCRAVASRWFGEPAAPAPSTITARRLTDLTAAPAPSGGTHAKDAELDLLAAAQMKELGLELDTLVQRLHQLASEELDGQPELIFQKIVRESAAATAVPPIEKWLEAADRLFGPRGEEGGDGFQSSPLRAALAQRLPEVISPLGTRLRDWLLVLPENPASRVYGAQRCAKSLQGHLKSIAEKAKETRGQIGAQLATVEQRLALALNPPTKAAKNAKEAPPPPDALFLQHCQLRLYQLAAHVAGQVVHGLAGFVTQGTDKLHDLARDIKHLSAQFAPPAESHTSRDELRKVALEHLSQDEESSAVRIDEYFRKTLYSAGGFRQAISQGGQQRELLIADMRRQARREVLHSLDKISLPAVMVRLAQVPEGGTSPLTALMTSARPWLEQVGGERRLLCVWPSTAEAMEPAALIKLIGKDRFGELPAVLAAPASQIVFCYELGNVPLAHAAAQLIDRRPELAQAAGRLQARTDMAWQELLATR